VKKLVLLLLAFAVTSFALAASKTVSFAVTGWSCGSCAAATRIALKKLDGVENVDTNIENAAAVVTYDDAKVTTEKMIQAIEKLGYKATVKAAAAPPASSPRSHADTALSSPGSPERVSFFEVPLECAAAAGLGCGSAAKPILKSLGRDARVAEAKINYSGTVLAVGWNDADQARAGAAAVVAAFNEKGLDAALLRGATREKALNDFESARWYRASDLDRLSEREAEVIASRIVNRARPRLGLTPERLAALTQDLAAVFARHLTRDTEEECAVSRDVIDQELTKAASKHLDKEQLAELRKAGEQGVQAEPGEAR
jgi:mercuric transport protein